VQQGCLAVWAKCTAKGHARMPVSAVMAAIAKRKFNR
jgi:hypothetical protein